MEKYQTNIFDYARRGIANGINICRLAVEGTIGGAGKNVIIRKEFYPFYISTKDAFSILQAIKCKNPLENQAVDMMRDATDSMNKIAKDGRTAMCILTDAILQEVEKQGLNPSQAEKDINELLPLIEKEIDEQTEKISVKDIEKVAHTASNNERLAKIIGEVYKRQGKDCIINYIEGSGTHEDYVIYHDGVRFQGTGFLTESFVHEEGIPKEKQKRAVYENPYILVTKRRISAPEDIDAFLTRIKDKNTKGERRGVVIFTDDMDSNVATQLVQIHQAGILDICVIKAPVLWKQFVFEDFAKCTGATIVEDATGVTFDNLGFEHLGNCAKIVIDKDECILTGTADLSSHIAYLKSLGDDDSLRRVWWLTTKTATLRLGANNEGELSNLRLAAQDAVYSCQAALQEGVVKGGGVCLWNISGKIDNWFSNILQAPVRQIAYNAGKEIPDFMAEIPDYVMDSALVVKNSLRQAVKIASIVLKTDKLIDIPKKDMLELQAELLQKQRIPFQ